MTTGSYLEHYLTLLAWVINNGIWNTLVFTGLFALALGAIIVSEWMDARAQGADEGNKGVLSVLRVENRIYVAYLVILFACVPLLPLDITQLKFDSTRSKECGVNVAAPEQTGWGKVLDGIGNQSGKVPVWWALVHVISKGITASATAAIPCYFDVRGVAMEVDETRIPDKALAAEVNDFTKQCYSEAHLKLNKNTPDLTAEQYNDVGWIGSKYFLSQSGYYDIIQSKYARKGWSFKEDRDATFLKYESGPLTGAGYPYCKNWWSDKTIGLRDRLVKTVKPDLWVRIKKWSGWSNDDMAEEETLRQLVRPSHLQSPNELGEYNNWDDAIYGTTANNSRGQIEGTTKMMAHLGTFLKGMSLFPSMHALRTALPMLQAFLIMAIIICLPLIIVMSTYDLKVVMMTSFGLFTLHMLSFWWELARWLDSSLISALYNNPFHGVRTEHWFITAPLSQQVLQLVIGVMFIVLPGLFFVAMSWAGYALGRGMDGMLTGGTGPAKEAGATGGDAAAKAGKAVVSRGISKGK